MWYLRIAFNINLSLELLALFFAHLQPHGMKVGRDADGLVMVQQTIARRLDNWRGIPSLGELA